MMGKTLTEAQVANLRHVETFGEAKPRSPSGYWCRTHGLSEYVWLLGDGRKAAWREVVTGNKLVRIVGERITDAGRLALKEMEKTDE